ncbi:MAG: GldG family protein, partial [Pseudomonadota bacterium]|nr:GldG family protein [Pseudomonadota bacterium]
AGAGRTEAAEKPDLMLLTALPLVWGELGPLDASSRPAAAFKSLEREFAVRPLDVLDRTSLGSGTLLLLAQPRALAPTEFVALDDWVRNGGRALILTDPQLIWPSELPLGDIRRPPAIGLLGPVLEHWGLRLDPPAEPRAKVEQISSDSANRRLVMFAPGRLSSNTRLCTVALHAALADCRIGKGRAIVLADADMLHDRLWVGPVGSGTERHTRLADNPLVVADQLDALAGVKRERLAGNVQWFDPAADRRLAVALGLFPLLLAATPAIARTIRRRR